MKINERIGEFVSNFSSADIPQDALDVAKSGVIDYVGVLISGAEEESSRLVRNMAGTLGGNPQATIWSTGEKTSVALAALANGTAAHALDYDDTNPVMLAHPSIQLLPGLFALGEYTHSGGMEMLAAYIAGFEIGAKLARILNPEHIKQGWFPVGTLGPLMEAAACSRLLGLSSEQVQMAVGIAANLASGLRCNSGTMVKQLTAGHAASSGVVSALLAREGMTANSLALEDRFGYLENFSRGNSNELESVMDLLGNPLDIVESGLSFKRYPCCAGTHNAIDCALDIVQNHSLQVDEIESINILMHAGVKSVLIHQKPTTSDQAKFSVDYCVSRAFIDRKVGPQQFERDKINDKVVSALIRKIKIKYHNTPVSKVDIRSSRFPVEMDVRLRDGTVYSSRVDYASGTPANPLLPAEIEQKFKQCLSGKLSDRKAHDIFCKLNHFENISDMQVLIDMVQYK